MEKITERLSKLKIEVQHQPATINEWLVKNAEAIIDNMEYCFLEPPMPSPGFPHESMPSGQTSFQNWIIAEVINQKAIPYFNKHIEIMPRDKAALLQLKDYLENNQVVFVEEIKKYYSYNSDRKEKFAQFRLQFFGNNYKKMVEVKLGNKTSEDEKSYEIAPVEKIIPPTTIEDKSAEFTAPKTVLSTLPKFDPDEPIPIKVIKCALSAISERCFVIYNTLKELYSSTKIDKVEFLEKFVDSWDEFFITCLEFEEYFKPACNAINQAFNLMFPKANETEDRYPAVKKVPIFSFWRQSTGFFREIVFDYLKDVLILAFKEKLLVLIKSQVEAKKSMIKAEEEQAKSAQAKKFQPRLPNFRQIRGFSRIFMSLVDMTINEISTHYVEYKEITPRKFLHIKCHNAIEGFINDGIFNSDVNTLIDSEANFEKKIRIVEHIKEVLNEVFIPSLYNKINKKCLDKIKEILTKEIDSVKGGSNDWDGQGVPKKEKEWVEKAKDKLKLTLEEKVINFLIIKHEKVVDKYLDCLEKINKAGESQIGILDIEIEIRSERLGIPKTTSIGDEYDNAYRFPDVDNDTYKYIVTGAK